MNAPVHPHTPTFAYVYPDGHVTDRPDPARSDDFFTVSDCTIEGAPELVVKLVREHFGTTGQAFDVLACLLTYAWMR